MYNKSITTNPKNSQNESILFFKPKYDHISEVDTASQAEDSSEDSTSHRPQIVKTDVHLPPSSPAAFHVYKSGKWKSDEEPIISEENSSSSSSIKEIKVSSPPPPLKQQKKINSRQSSSSSTTTEQQYTSPRIDTGSQQSEVSKVEEGKFLGIYLHQTSNLKFDIKIRCPQVLVSLVDLKTGQLAVYSQDTIKQKQLEQPFILPEATGPCTFISNIALRCQWEQLVYFKEHFSHFKLDENIIFFEILQPSDSDDPYKIAWAFFRPINEKQFEPMQGERLKLQLYKYKKLPKRLRIKSQNMSVYNQWSAKDCKKYCGNLEVTIKTLIQAQLSKENLHENTTNLDNLKELPQIPYYQVPNSLFYKKREQKKGCLVTKFSPCGKYLAYSTEDTITILNVPSMECTHVLQGHQGLVHDLDWQGDDCLVSASADSTAIVWRFEENFGIFSRVLPHSSFVYCAKFAADEFVITGGRDGFIRVWNYAPSVPQLVQEIDDHSDYITSILYSDGVLITADSHGILMQWKVVQGGLKKEQEITLPKLKNKKILSMTSHHNKIFFMIHGEPEIFVLGFPSLLLQTVHFKNELNGIHQQISLSLCGRFLFAAENERVLAYDLSIESLHKEVKVPGFKNGSQFISSISNNFNYLAVGVYGFNGGLFVFKNNSVLSGFYQHEHKNTATAITRKPIVKPTGYLANVIEKIDHLLFDSDRGDFEYVAVQDETEFTETVQEEEEEQYTFTQDSGNRTYSISGNEKERADYEVKEAESLNENLTFSVHKSEKDKKNKKRKKEFVQNLTFSIDDKPEKDEDDTTISDSLH